MEENKKEIIDITPENKTENEAKQETKKDRKGFAIASMVLGIVALVLFCIWYISIPCGILAIIFGILSVKSTGKGMAIAGLITGGIGTAIAFIIFMAIFTIGFIAGITEAIDEIDYHDSYYDSSFYDYE